MHKKTLSAGVIASLVLSSLSISLNAAADMSMKISNLCNIDSKYWVVQIYNPSGYIKSVAGDGSFTVPSNVPVGSRLSALIISGSYCADKYPQDKNCSGSVSMSVSGPWTASSDGGVLPVVQQIPSKYVNCNYR